jgi:hypothetical protein
MKIMKGDWRRPRNKELYKLLSRYFGIIKSNRIKGEGLIRMKEN